MMHPALTQYVQTTSHDFRKRLALQLGDTPDEQLHRFSRALDTLQERKAQLVQQLSENLGVSHRVPGGLGAICISAVQSHVTPILTAAGVATDIIARQYPFEWSNTQQLPPIHAYNIVALGSNRLVVDIDADPFLGYNTGIVVAPLAADLPIYSVGFAYHERSVSASGQIARFSCSLFDSIHGVRIYMEGDFADHISVAPYHFESGENRCPIVLPGGATLYFWFDKVHNERRDVLHEISLIAVCRIPGHETAVYNLRIDSIHSFRVRRVDRGRTQLSVQLEDQSTFELLIASDGILLANDYFNLRVTQEHLPETVSARLSNKTERGSGSHRPAGEDQLLPL